MMTRLLRQSVPLDSCRHLKRSLGVGAYVIILHPAFSRSPSPIESNHDKLAWRPLCFASESAAFCLHFTITLLRRQAAQFEHVAKRAPQFGNIPSSGHRRNRESTSQSSTGSPVRRSRSVPSAASRRLTSNSDRTRLMQSTLTVTVHVRPALSLNVRIAVIP